MRGSSDNRNTVSIGAADRASVRSLWRFSSTLTTASHDIVPSGSRPAIGDKLMAYVPHEKELLYKISTAIEKLPFEDIYV